MHEILKLPLGSSQPMDGWMDGRMDDGWMMNGWMMDGWIMSEWMMDG